MKATLTAILVILVLLGCAVERPGGRSTRTEVPILIERLYSKSWLNRASAANELGELGPEAKAAVPNLITALHDENGEVRKSAALALYLIGEPAREGLPILFEMLSNNDIMSRVISARAISEIGPPYSESGTFILMKALKDESYDVRSSAIKAISQLPYDDKIAKALYGCLEDNNNKVIIDAALAIHNYLKDDHMIDIIIDVMINDKIPFMQTYAAYALGAIGDPAKRAIPLLERMKQESKTMANKEIYENVIIQINRGEPGG